MTGRICSRSRLASVRISSACASYPSVSTGRPAPTRTIPTHLHELRQLEPEHVQQPAERLAIRLLALVRVLAAHGLLRARARLKRVDNLPKREHLHELELVAGLLEPLREHAQQRDRRREPDRERRVREQREEQVHRRRRDRQRDVDPACSARARGGGGRVSWGGAGARRARERERAPT